MEVRPVNHYIKRLFSQSAIYGIGDIGSKILTLFLIPIHTYYLTPPEYSIFTLFILFYSFGLTFYLLGINSGFIRYFLDERYDNRDVFSTAFLFISVFNVFLSILVIAFSKELSEVFFDNIEYKGIFYYGAMILLLESLSSLVLLIYRAQNNPVGFVTAIIVRISVILGSNLIFLSILKLGLYGAVLGNLTGSVSLLLILSFEVKKLLHLKFSLGLFKKMFRYGIPTVPAVLSLTMLIMIDQYLLKIFGFFDKVGIYAVGYKMGMALSIVITGFRFAWFPFIFQVSKQKEAQKIFSTVFNYFNFFLIFFYLLISIYIPVFFKYIFSPVYYESINLIPIVALGYIFYGYYENFIVGIYIKDRTHYIAIVITAAAFLNIVLNLILIPIYNMYGAAWATAVSYLVLALLGYFFSQKFYSIKYDFRKIFKVISGGTLIMVVNLIFKDIHILVKLSFPFLYFLVLYLVRFFKADDINLIRSLFKKDAD
ncbi:MAG: polysaccharide biosynthesis C-terminal domain-containing protein [Candidatus Helarchaeota archaeon]|nr:polysaccharide biosynthesis C-terminal domain-containing protein [Candidatus Helarchaeota archaeon]